MLKKLSIIAAVAVMLAGATSASAYHETWGGWFNSGYLTFLGATFNYSYGSGLLEDTTANSVDSFRITTVNVSGFTCASGDYEGYYIKLWPDAAGGYKTTGQSGQRPSSDGVWSGTAKLYNPSNQLIQTFTTVSGTWASTSPHFDYTSRPYSYTASWVLNYSDPVGLSGEGGSEGERQ